MNLSINLNADQQADLLETLRIRFEDNDSRHEDLTWEKVQSRLAEHPEKLGALYAMEQTGGEPDVVGQDQSTGEVIFFDCSPESPSGRRSLCFDQEALMSRKRNKPEGSAVAMAAEMSVTLLSEAEYRSLQNLGSSTSSPPVGCSPRPKCASWAVRSSVTAASTPSSPTTTGPNPTTPPGGSGLRCGYSIPSIQEEQKGPDALLAYPGFDFWIEIN